MIGLGHLPSIENLQCFIAGATHLNFRQAAQQMALTPAAFGQRIRQLEDQLKVSLFVRTTRHVELTEAGRRLVPVAEITIRDSRACINAVVEDCEPPAHITLATRYELGMSWVLPSVLELQNLYPNWDIDMYFGSGQDIESKLQMGQVDGIITSAPIARSSWLSEFLHPEYYVFVATPELLEQCPFDNFSDAKDHVLLDINSSLPLTRYLTSKVGNISFKRIRSCGAGAAIIQLLLRQEGIAVVPEYMVHRELEEGILVRLCDDENLQSDSFRLIFRRTSMLEPVLKKMGEFLRTRPLE